MFHPKQPLSAEKPLSEKLRLKHCTKKSNKETITLPKYPTKHQLALIYFGIKNKKTDQPNILTILHELKNLPKHTNLTDTPIHRNTATTLVNASISDTPDIHNQHTIRMQDQ
jgi:hypothetical protein